MMAAVMGTCVGLALCDHIEGGGTIQQVFSVRGGEGGRRLLRGDQLLFCTQ